MSRLSRVSWLSACALWGCSWVVDSKLDGKPSQDPPGAQSPDGGDPGRADGGKTPDTPDDGGDITSEDAGDGMTDDAGTAGGLDRSAIRLSLGTNHACGLLPNGKLTCWGSNSEGQRVLPAGSYLDVACGDFHTCAITQAGKIVCVGRNRDGQRVSKDGPFIAVAAGDAHTCALDKHGMATCWGSDEHGVLTTTQDALTAITAGDGYACGIRKVDSTATCWGYSASKRTTPPIGTKLRNIDAGRAHACGVTPEDNAICWGDSAFSPGTLLDVEVVTAGDDPSCVLLRSGSVYCWSEQGEYTLPEEVQGPYAQLASGNTAVCLVPVTGAMSCISDVRTGIVPAPPGFPE